MRSHLVISGPSGSGKSTVGQLVATQLGRVWLEGDAFHTVQNRNRMAEGIALTDEDRAPWLDRLAQELRRLGDLGLPAVLACSALKRSYRDVLRGCGHPVTVVQLQVSPEDLAARVAARRAHFMPTSLLASQIALMEPLEPDEDGVSVPTGSDAQSTAAAVLTALDPG
ncbi:gluconokinase [Micrococcus terreus]|uniref:gluconokinase n=1 Tax=Micrococcus terreus TaxID=574650 RepID=UPI00254F3134|nr:gluconokinase, GntK/IdnK-type [Micrococcus terreus]MDK7700049.1 gluconokinase, GntK/IdnK-type [Micrococcus terreus]WOO97084.1 gluconokinase, GntK/IdnK-type [Micrococcus terreus]